MEHFCTLTCGFFLYETGSIATGDLSFTSTEQIEMPPPSTTEPINLSDTDAHDVSMNPFAENMDQQSDPLNVDETEPMSSTCSVEKRGGDSGKKRNQSQVAAVLQDYVNFRKKQTKTFVDELNGPNKLAEDYSIKNCLNLLELIEELSDEEKAKATSIFKCELNREIFINFKNPRVRLLWVKGEIAPKVYTLTLV